MAIGVAVIGAGMAGRGHAAAYRSASSMYGSDLPPINLVAVADVNPVFGEATAKRFGFQRAVTDWREIASDPEITAVSVVVANHLHEEIVEGLLRAGKHVLCEKPLSDSLESAKSMVTTAKEHNLVARIGLTFLRNPAIAAIQRIVSSGKLGRVVHFSGRYWCDYSLDPHAPISWRYKGPLGTGALADVGSHITYISEFITGSPVASVSGTRFRTSVSQRPVPSAAVVGHAKAEVSDQLEPVENDDYAGFTASLGEAVGSIEVSRVAAGHPTSLTFEVFCEQGAASFDQRVNGEFQLFVDDGESGENGYRRVLIGPEHPYISGGLPVDAGGVGVGQNDQFFFQNRAFLQEVAGLEETRNLPFCPTFEDGLHNMEILDKVVESFKANGKEVSLSDYEPTYLRKWK